MISDTDFEKPIRKWKFIRIMCEMGACFFGVPAGWYMVRWIEYGNEYKAIFFLWLVGVLINAWILYNAMDRIQSNRDLKAALYALEHRKELYEPER